MAKTLNRRCFAAFEMRLLSRHLELLWKIGFLEFPSKALKNTENGDTSIVLSNLINLNFQYMMVKI